MYVIQQYSLRVYQNISKVRIDWSIVVQRVANCRFGYGYYPKFGNRVPSGNKRVLGFSENMWKKTPLSIFIAFLWSIFGKIFQFSC